MNTINPLSRQSLLSIKNQESLNQPDINKDKMVSPVVCNLARIQNSPERLCKQEDFVADLKRAQTNQKSRVEADYIKSDTQALKPWQRELAQQKEAYARSAPEREAAEIGKANRPAAALKLDAKGIPLPPPPPINMPAKKPDSSSMVFKTSINHARKQEAEMKHCQDDLIKDLTAALAKRAGKTCSEIKPPLETLKPWQRELAQQKEAYARSAPEREAAEAKEEKRVRVALNAEKAEKAKQKAAEIGKANRPAAALKLDAKGIPLPPPPPINMPAKKPDSSSMVFKPSINHARKQEAEMKHCQDNLIKDLTAALAKRAGKTCSEIKPPLETLKPWQKELAELKLAYEHAAPQRKIAEAKEEARVTIALKAEAAEKAKMKAAESEKENKPIATLKFDEKGIPLPPPMGRFK